MKHLAKQLDARSQNVRQSAAEALVRFLADPDPEVRGPAAEALGQRPDGERIEGVVAALGHGRPEVREAAAALLASMGAAAVPPLVRAITASNARFWVGAAHALRRLRDPQAVASLAAALASDDWMVRVAVANALGQIGDTAAVEALTRAGRSRLVRAPRGGKRVPPASGRRPDAPFRTFGP